MRAAYAVGLAAFLAVSPAMAQVIIGGGDNDAARHEAQAQQDRADAHQDMNQACRDAAPPLRSSATPTATAAAA